MPKTKSNVLSSRPLSSAERGRLLINLEPLVQYLGSPGNWGYESDLANLTIQAKSICHSLRVLDAEENDDTN